MMDANRVTARIKYSVYIHHALSSPCGVVCQPEIALSVELGVRHHRNRPWFRPGDPVSRLRLVGNAYRGKAGVDELTDQAVARKKPHLQRRTRTSMKDKVGEDLLPSVGGAVLQATGTVDLDKPVVVQIRKMLARFRFERIRHGKNENAIRFKQSAGVYEGP